MEYVTQKFCDERHKGVDEAKRRLGNHGSEIDAMHDVVNKQTNTLESLVIRLENIDARVKRLEEKPLKKWEKVLDTVINWGTLLVLGLIAAKIGL